MGHKVARIDGEHLTYEGLRTLIRTRGHLPCGCRQEYYIYNYPVKDPSKPRKARFLPGTRVWLWDWKYVGKRREGGHREYAVREGVVASIDACSRNDQTFYTVELLNGRRVSWRGGQNIKLPGAVPNNYGLGSDDVYLSPSGVAVE